MRALRRSILLAALVAVTVVGPAQQVAGQDSGAGTVVLVDPADRTRVLRSGGSETPYQIRLPQGAACPGDSLNDDWRVSTFIVPASEDIAALIFGIVGPDGPTTDAKWALYTESGNNYSLRLTFPNSQPGQPGVLDRFQPMTFSRYPVETLPPGRYVLGVACSRGSDGTTGKYWSTEIELTHDASAEPTRLEWVVRSASVVTSPGAGSSGVGTWIALAVLVVGAGAFVLLRRHSRQGSTPRVKETT